MSMMGKNDMSTYHTHLEYDKCSQELKNAVQAWIALVFQPAKGIYRHMDSYGLKHRFQYSAENYSVDLYMTNGEFKGAMLVAGYEPIDRNAQNWQFKIKSRSTLARYSKRHLDQRHPGTNICLCHCTQQELDHYSEILTTLSAARQARFEC